MKNIQNRINAQLFKQETVELQSEKVELNLIKELKDAINDAYNYKDSVYKGLPNASPLIQKTEKAIQTYMFVGVESKRISKKIKELGLNPDETVERALKTYKGNIKELEKVLAVLRQLDKI